MNPALLVAGMLLLLVVAGGAEARMPPDLPNRIRAAARAAGVDGNLLAAISEVESSTGRNPAARGVHPDRVSVGILGVTPGAAQLALGRPVSMDALTDVATNLKAGAEYLARQLRRYGGDLAAASRAYHMGTDPHDPSYPSTHKTGAMAEGDRYWRAIRAAMETES